MTNLDKQLDEVFGVMLNKLNNNPDTPTYIYDDEDMDTLEFAKAQIKQIMMDERLKELERMVVDDIGDGYFQQVLSARIKSLKEQRKRLG